MNSRLRRASRFVLILLVMACGVTAFNAAPAPTDPGTSPTTTIFDADPLHPWNQVYAALLLRSFEGRVYGDDLLGALLWRKSTVLLGGDTHERAMQALDLFLRTNAARRIVDSVHRAVFQHDLWAVYDWLADPFAPSQPARAELRARLLEVMKRIALSPEEIAHLPHNLDAAIASAVYLKQFDPGHPDRAFLPDALGAASGWVPVSDEHDRQLAPEHQQLTRGRSAVHIYLRLPGGTAETSAYLEKLRDFPEPWKPDEAYAQFPYARAPLFVNPHLPQPPRYTAVMLIRTLLVIDTQGVLHETPLVENVQLRVMAKDPAESRFGDLSQATYDFVLRRRVLFANVRGGLEPSFQEPFQIDPTFDPDRDALEGTPELFRPTPPHQDQRAPSCLGCHTGAGILSVQSFIGGAKLSPPRPIPKTDDPDAATHWKMQQFEMGMLRAEWSHP